MHRKRILVVLTLVVFIALIPMLTYYDAGTAPLYKVVFFSVAASIGVFFCWLLFQSLRKGN